MKKIIFITLVLFSAVACEKREDKILISDLVSKTQYYDNEIFNEENQKIYGKWKYLSISGGIAGSTYDPNYNYLEVIRFGIYGKITDHKVKEYGQLIINKQEDTETRIDFFSADNYRTDSFLDQKVVRFEGNDTLILWDGLIDGYFSHYIRIK